MADIQISVDAGTQTRLLTAEKYCAENILVTAGESSKMDNWTDVIDGSTTFFFDSKATLITNNAFKGNVVITSVSMINAAQGLSSCFQDASNLELLYLPTIQTTGNLFAYTCPKLKWAYMGQAKYLAQYAFWRCSALNALILAFNQVASLADANGIESSGIASGTGYIYVPDDLVEQYKVATNWATYADQIKGMSEIPAEVQEWLDQQGGASA